jgi:hypothetical protein
MSDEEKRARDHITTEGRSWGSNGIVMTVATIATPDASWPPIPWRDQPPRNRKERRAARARNR